MQIIVAFLTGKKIELFVGIDDTVFSVMQKVQDAEGIPVDDQRMIYSGKQMDARNSLSYYEVKQGATIHIVLKLRQPQTNDSNTHNPNARSLDTIESRLTPLEVQNRSQNQSNAMSNEQEEFKATLSEIDSDSEQDFDDDDYLINPHSHYEQLNVLEKVVVESSEYYHSKGNYEPNISHIENADILFASLHCRPKVLKCLDKIINFSSTISMPFDEANQSTICVALSLCKSYLILSHILDVLENLTQKGFCDDSFTILIRQAIEPHAIAEMVEVDRDMIINFHEGIAATLTQILKSGRPLSDRITSAAILEALMPACQRLMENLGIAFSGQLSLHEILLLCRILTLILDIGLVSYMGSHGSRFDMEYMDHDHPELLVASDFQTKIGFLFSLQRLACLDQFLNCQQVWTIQPLWTIPRDLKQLNSPLSILTTIEAFADTWGPLWEVSAGSDFPDHIRQLNVSTGLICRAEGMTECPVEGAVSCHWFDSSGLIPIPSPGECDNTLIPKSQKLLISGLPDSSLETKKACSYKLDGLEGDYGLFMTPLGTSASSWTYEERQVGFSASQYIGITVLGTQKKLPCTTQKQAIWNKWTNQPRRANPRILNSYLGVEISHCTGNARRVKLRDIFTMKQVQALLSRQFPNWILADFGMSLQSAFYSDHDITIEDVWVKHYEARDQIAELVCYVLEMLEKTGISAQGFSAAFLNQQRELSMPIEPRLNSWTEFLEDSHLTAVYAIVNENCLDKGERGHFVATCNAESTKPTEFTAFETQIAVSHGVAAKDRIKLNQRGCLQRVSRTEEGVQVLTWDAGRARELGSKLGKLLGSKRAPILSREVQDRYELGGQHVPVLVKSIVPSYGGLSVKRNTHAKKVVEQEIKLQGTLPIRATVGESRILQLSVLHQEQPQRPGPPAG